MSSRSSRFAARASHVDWQIPCERTLIGCLQQGSIFSFPGRMANPRFGPSRGRLVGAGSTGPWKSTGRAVEVVAFAQPTDPTARPRSCQPDRLVAFWSHELAKGWETLSNNRSIFPQLNGTFGAAALTSEPSRIESGVQAGSSPFMAPDLR
jgi:hypothetical protein